MNLPLKTGLAPTPLRIASVLSLFRHSFYILTKYHHLISFSVHALEVGVAWKKSKFCTLKKMDDPFTDKIRLE